MIPVGPVDATFNVRTQAVDVCFDQTSQQQVLSFQFALTVSLPQLIQQCMEYQRRSGAPGLNSGGAPGLNTGGAPGLTPSPMANAVDLASPAAVPPEMQRPMRMQQPPRSHMADRQQQQQQQQQAPQQQPQQPPPQPQQQQQWEGISDLNNQLVSYVRKNDTGRVRQLLAQKAEVNHRESNPSLRTPLQHALEAGGDIHMVSLLLQANSEVNIAMQNGRTVCHYAIEQYMTIPSIVVRMLICATADLTRQDARNMSPIETAKMVARNSFNSPGDPQADIQVRQLLNEVTEQPTVAVSTVDQPVLNVVFADTVSDTIAFHTESALYLYSVKHERVVYLKKLRQLTCRSSVQHVAVNPELGTIAVCLEVTGGPTGECIQNVSIVWPNGQLTDEEPLKLTTPFSEGPRRDTMPACFTLSRCRGPQMLVCRFSNSEVYSWRLNSARSQLVHESKLLSFGGHIATSDDGRWIAAENKDVNPDQGEVCIWCYETLEGLPRAAKLVHTIDKRPTTLSVMQEDTQSCQLALVEWTAPGQPLPPIEVFSISTSGACNNLYRVRLAAPCISLTFCHGMPTHLLSGHEDGLVVVCDLPAGLISLSHDGPNTRSISISSDRTLIASAEGNYFRVYKVPPYEEP